jgi:RHS repeat-associated protein
MKVRVIVPILASLFCANAWAAPPNRQQYIVKLKYLFAQPNASAAAPIKDVVVHGGDHVDFEWLDRLVVTLPDTAVDAIAKHAATEYMQPVRSGPATASATPSSLHAHTEASGTNRLSTSPASAQSVNTKLRAVPESFSTWDSGVYSYDGAGNIIAIGTDAFVYDSLSRLRQASVRGNTETYTIDPLGNLIQKTTGTLVVDLTTNAATNHLSAQTYDTAGNLTGATTETNVYDPFSMLREKDMAGYGSEYYVYNANDERIAVISNPCGTAQTPANCTGALITMSGRDEAGKVLRQFDLPYQQFSSAPWLWLEDYIYRDGLLLGGERTAAEGGRRHFHLDHLGSPRLVTGTGGVSLGAHDYYPFGVEITPLRQETTAGMDREEPMKFTGHERDFNIGTSTENANYNDYMHARSTVAQWGRFMSVDPVISKAAMRSPQLWNRYSYVGNSPLRFTDPTGKYICIGSTAQCSAFEGARLASRDSSRASEAVKNAVNAYGDPGKDNGITVGFGDPGKGRGASAALHPEGEKDAQGKFTGRMMLVGIVTVRPELSGSVLQATVAHEGSHIADGQAFAASFANGGAHWSNVLNLTGRQTEMNAYSITAQVATITNTTFPLDGGTFQPHMLPSAVDAVTQNILRLTYKPSYLVGSAFNWDLTSP